VLQLIVAEEAANRALYQLEQARARISAVEAEARVMEQYRDLVEEGREQFHREMASIMPDVKLGELNMFITHAYRKVSRVIRTYSEGGGVQLSVLEIIYR
jgi:MICOS complex subunit MIC60